MALFETIAGFFWIIVLGIILALKAIVILNEWERAVVLTFGKYSYTLNPGINFVIPFVQQVIIIDIRIQTADIPRQQAITKDNVPVTVNGVLFFKVEKVTEVVLKVQNFKYAIFQYAQTVLRDVVGEHSLDQVLSERQEIGLKIQETVDIQAKKWGLDVTEIRMQDIEMPEDLKRLMSRQASSEREKRATIIKAEGDKIAAGNLAAAAKIMRTTPGAMQLRTLQTIDGLGPTASNTVVLALPVDVLEAAKAFARKKSPQVRLLKK
ncbi:MAG: SPFH domain-containing protein [Candidatus Micrarchaeia archaeon]